MNYLQNRKTKKKNLSYIIAAILVCVVLLFLKLGIFNGFSYGVHFIFRPILVLGGKVREIIHNSGAYFISKSSLLAENQNLKSELIGSEARMVNYNSVLSENDSLKEILGRLGEKSMTLSAILSKPNQSPYDTLIIDAGSREGIKSGDAVFAFGSVPIGTVAEAYANTSKVTLFSSSGEKRQVVIGKGIFAEIVGRGGGNFEMKIPRDLALAEGDQATMPGLTPRVVAVVQTIISDPRDPFIKALLVAPVNIQELKFVEVDSQK